MVPKKEYTVKLVAQKDNARALLFKELILRGNSNYKLFCDEISPEHDKAANYNIFFDFSGFEDRKDKLGNTIASLYDLGSLPVLDITENWYLDKTVGPQQAISTVAAGFVTCDTDKMQEKVFEFTGRLPTIVYRPLFPNTFDDPDSKSVVSPGELNILWFGDNSELFTIKAAANKDKRINTYSVPSTGSLTKGQQKIFQRHLDAADIVFFPKTFTEEMEENRLHKVEAAIERGKFVVAPDLALDFDGVAFHESLAKGIVLYFETDVSEWIRDSQAILKRKYNPDISWDQLAFALKEALTDDYAKNLDYFLDTEIL